MPQGFPKSRGVIRIYDLSTPRPSFIDGFLSDTKGDDMKTACTLSFIFFGGTLYAIPAKLCTNCVIPTGWTNDNSLPGTFTGGIGWNNISWTATITGTSAGTVGGVGKCTSHATDPDSAPSATGTHCWCRIITINGINCPSAWASFGEYGTLDNCQNTSTDPVPCAQFCAYVMLHGSYISNWFRSSLLAPSITCPPLGICRGNSNYQTVTATVQCPAGWVETTAPKLTISGNNSDAKGNFYYNICMAN